MSYSTAPELAERIPAKAAFMQNLFKNILTLSMIAASTAVLQAAENTNHRWQITLKTEIGACEPAFQAAFVTRAGKNYPRWVMRSLSSSVILCGLVINATSA
jgi:hypothetical protein